MKVDLTKKFINPADDSEYTYKPEQKDATGKVTQEKEALTLKNVIISALISDEEKESFDSKMSKYKLVQKVKKGNKYGMVFSIDDLKLIKDQIGKYFATPIVGQAVEFLEGNEEEVEQIEVQENGID
jgi:hypothetical protein